MPKKLTIEYIREEFNKRGYTLLSEEYQNNKQLLDYICPNGHRHKINWGRFQQGQECPYCTGALMDFNIIKEEFAKRNYTLLSTEYMSYNDKLEYICPKGHKHSISWANFRKGHGCPECDGQYINFDTIKHEFESRGCELLSSKEEYKNNLSKLKYKCENGHIHETNWSNFRVSKVGCIRQYVDINFVKDFFESQGCKLLTEKYDNNNQELKYICPKGKIHTTTWRRFFNRSQRCKCFKIYKGEEKVEKILSKNSINFIEQYWFKDCRYKYPLKFDFYLPENNICIEYDGLGHFEPINFGGKREEEVIEIFKEGQIRDQIKNKYCKDNNITLIRIPYWDFDNIENILKEHLKF